MEAWGVVLQTVQGFLVEPLPHRNGCKDLLAVMLAQRPHTPEATDSYHKATKYLLCSGLKNTQDIAITLLNQRRQAVAYANAARLTAPDALVRAPGGFSSEYPFVFQPARALGESEEDALNQCRHVVKLARNRVYGRLMVPPQFR